MPDTTKLLIVDDVPENIGTLFNFLSRQQFQLLVAQDGESALEVAGEECPDLILLDIMMPGIDGFETCRQLKADPRTRDIPVIFMSALSDPVDKVRGFELGAVDYLTKPVHREEVLARLHTHLSVHRLQRELQEKNLQLDAFAHSVAHDLKNPLTVILNMSRLLAQRYADCLGREGGEYLQDIARSAQKSAEIVDALLLLAGASCHARPGYSPLDMGEVLAKAVQRLKNECQAAQADIRLPAAWPRACGYAPWVEEVWFNYLSNALKYGGRPPRIELGADEEAGRARFWVKDNGDGLCEEDQAKLFTPFNRFHDQQFEGHGLGLAIVRAIVERLGGETGAECRPGAGCLFYFTLPLECPEAATPAEPPAVSP